VVVLDSNGDVINAHKIASRSDDIDEVQAVSDLILRYNAVQVVCDIGYGARQVKELQREFGERVRSCYYSSRPMTPFEYKKRDNNRNLIYMCVVDRTTYVEDTLESIKNREFRLAFNDRSLEWVLHEWCAVNSSQETDLKDTRPTRGQRMTKYGRDGDDHALHALIYARIAMEVGEGGGTPTMRTFGA